MQKGLMTQLMFVLSRQTLIECKIKILFVVSDKSLNLSMDWTEVLTTSFFFQTAPEKAQKNQRNE